MMMDQRRGLEMALLLAVCISRAASWGPRKACPLPSSGGCRASRNPKPRTRCLGFRARRRTIVSHPPRGQRQTGKRTAIISSPIPGTRPQFSTSLSLRPPTTMVARTFSTRHDLLLAAQPAFPAMQKPSSRPRCLSLLRKSQRLVQSRRCCDLI